MDYLIHPFIMKPETAIIGYLLLRSIPILQRYRESMWLVAVVLSLIDVLLIPVLGILHIPVKYVVVISPLLMYVLLPLLWWGMLWVVTDMNERDVKWLFIGFLLVKGSMTYLVWRTFSVGSLLMLPVVYFSLLYVVKIRTMMQD